jgi:hypothetical protein
MIVLLVGAPVGAKGAGVGAYARLCTADFPFHARDAHLLAGLLVVVEPFVFAQVDARKLGARLCSRCEELALHACQSHWRKMGLH